MICCAIPAGGGVSGNHSSSLPPTSKLKPAWSHHRGATELINCFHPINTPCNQCKWFVCNMWKNQLLSQWMRPFQTKVSEWSLKRWNNLHPEELRWLALRPSRELKLHVDFWQTDLSNSRLKCEQFKSDSDRKPQPPSSVRVIEECDSETFSRSENSQQNPQGQWAREAPATRRSWRYRLVLFYYNNTHSISKKSLGKI